jgi:segregation and condensation protein A
MENPIFRLEGVVRSKGEMEDFVGPLELILQLLRKNKIEIADISISLILEQYLEYLDSLSSMDLEIASEFVAMASYLVYIKTKVLLSGAEEVDELTDLISSLEELRRRDCYAQIKSVTDALLDMYRRGAARMTKPPEYLEPDDSSPVEHSAGDLLAALLSLVDKEALIVAAEAKPFTYPSPIVYSVTEKTAEILTRIKTHGTMRLGALFGEARSRTEMVAVFVAVLELCRTGELYLIGCDEELTLCASGPDGGTAGEDDAAADDDGGEDAAAEE